MAVDVVVGVHGVRAVLAHEPERVLELWLADGRGGEVALEIAALAERTGITLRRVPRRTLDRHAGDGVRHQGVLARCRVSRRRKAPSLEDLLERHGSQLLLLAVDGVEDPRNLGAIVRVAACLGAQGVIQPRSRGAPLTAAAARAASGGDALVPMVSVPNLARALASVANEGVRVVGAAGDGEPLAAVDLTPPLVIVLGGEHGGLRRLTREHCDALAAIPMPGLTAGGEADATVDSLNVSVAAGILLHEAQRRIAGAAGHGAGIVSP